jgi:hypothetical protein
MRRPRRGQLYYGWVVAGVTALTLLVSIGLRTAPAVLIVAGALMALAIARAPATDLATASA